MAGFRDVTGYLDALEPSVRPEVESLRSQVLASDPRLVEIVKWNAPSYTLDGFDRLTITVSRSNEVRLILHRGVSADGVSPVSVDDPTGVLTWHSDIRASMSAGVDAAAGVAVIRSWLAD